MIESDAVGDLPVSEPPELDYGTRVAVERSRKLLSVLQKRRYASALDVEEHILEYLVVVYEMQHAGITLAELNRRFSSAKASVGKTPLQLLHGLLDRFQISIYSYKYRSMAGQYVLPIKFESDHAAVFAQALNEKNGTPDTAFFAQQHFIEQVRKRTLGLET